MKDNTHNSNNHDGETAKAIDLEQSEAKKINIAWPTPGKIKAKSIKHETVPLSFRVDEVDFAYMDLFAKQCDMSMSNFMNEIVRTYVEQNKTVAKGYVLPHAVNMSMERLGAKLKKMSMAEIIEAYHYGEIKAAVEEATQKRFDGKPKEICNLDTIKALIKSTGFVYLTDTLLKNCYMMPIYEQDTTQLIDYTNAEMDEQEAIGFADYYMGVPIEKWPVVTALTDHYSKKVSQLLSYENNELDKKDFEDMVEIIDQNQGEELIDNLIAKLKLQDQLRFPGRS